MPVPTPSDVSFILIMCLLSYAVAIPLRVGLLSLAPAAFAGIGAYTSALTVMKWGFTIPEGIAAASLGCGVLGAILGLPLSRVSGLYTGIATLGLVVVATGLEASLGVTGGSLGLISVPFRDLRTTLAISVASVALGWLVFDRTHLGRRFDLLAHDAVLARVSGISVMRYRTAALTLSAVLAGFAGALYAHTFYFLDPPTFDIYVVVVVVGYAVVGGTGYWIGPLAGAGVLAYVNILLRGYPNWSTVVVGVLMMLCVIFHPGGIAAPFRRVLRYRRAADRAREQGHGATKHPRYSA